MKKILSIFLVTLLLGANAYADVLGTHISSSRKEIALGTTFYTNVFDDSSVGKQTEHYFEYIPNDMTVPALTNGWTAYGKRTLTQANNILIQQGYNPVAGMNADFFSFQTGVPMSNTIIDGRIFTADSSWLPAIGFKNDGTAFIGTLPISTTVTTDDGSSFKVECINKYRQPYALYLFNKDFADNTHSPGWGRDVVLGNVSGDFKLGGTVTATVESISDNDGSVPIPDGKLILSVSADAAQELKDRLNCLTPGTNITISTTAEQDSDIWNGIRYAVGATGGKLLTNGQLDYIDESAAPRSAVGVRSDGSIIFYTIDGRQTNYSYGARKETVARRLLELGCTDAINLDGGGSTTIGYAEPGSKEFKVANSPSDGAQRSCANFLFVLNLCQADGIPYSLSLDNYGTALLSGATTKINATALDRSFGYASLDNGVTFYIEDDADTPDINGRKSVITDDGYITAYGNGDIYIGAYSDDAYGSTMIASVQTPESITIYNSDAGYQLNEIVLGPKETIQLDAVSTWYGTTLISDSSCYKWTVVSDNASVGNVNSDGFFSASDNDGATGKLVVNAGLCVTEIPIRISGGNSGDNSILYPQINGEVYSNIFKGNVSGDNIKKDNISITIDGERTDFDYENVSGNISFDIKNGKSDYHKIGVFVTADSGASSMKFFETANIASVQNKFRDTDSHWAKGYISYLSDCGIVNGSLEGDEIFFRPERHMTRTEFAIMLCNYLNLDKASYSDVELPFIDKDEIPWWAENSVKAIYSLNIMQGQLGQYGVSFNPNANINRMEFAIALNRLLPKGLKSEPIYSVDKDDIPFWAEDSMRVIFAQGIMTGYPDGTLRPTQSVTRAEGVKMLFNIIGAGK